MVPPFLRMPLRFLRGSAGGLALTVTALACGVALVCAIDLASRAVFVAFVEVVDTMAGRAALQVQAGEGGLFPEEIAATVGAVADVELAVPVVSATAFTADESGELLTVHGVDVTEDAAVRVYQTHDSEGLELDDPLVFLSQPDSIALTRTFATRRGLGVGDRITLETPTGRRPFTIRGLLEPTGVARVYAGNLVVMDIQAAEAAFTRPGLVNRVDVVLARTADVDAVGGAIAAVLPPGLRVERPTQRRADLHKVMASLQVLLRGVSLLGLVGAFLIAFNRLASVFDARLWQVGVLRAVGVSATSAWWELVKESLLIGAAGVALGLPLGVALGRLLLPVIVTTTALNYKLVAPQAHLVLDPASLGLAAVLGLATALLAAALPAWRAAGRPVATTLRDRGIEPPRATRRRSIVPWVALGAGTAVVVALQAATRSTAWGLLATVLIAVATAAGAGPLLRLLAAPMAAALARLAGPSSRFIMAALLQNPRRSALTAGTLGVGLGCTIWLWTVAQSFERSLVETLGGIMQADLVVGSSHVASGFLEAPLSDDLVSDLEGIPGVAAAAGERLIDWPYEGGPIAVNAFDAAYFQDGGFGRWPLFGAGVPDPWEAVTSRNAALVSTSFTLHLGAGVGDTITVDTPRGPLALEIAGVTSIYSSPRGTIIVRRELYERFWHDDQVTRVHVRTQDDADVAAVRARIARDLGRRYGLRIITSGDLVEYFAEQVRRAFAGGYALAGMVLVVVLIGMGDTLAGAVVEQTRQLGVIQAVGVDPSHVRRMVLGEAAALSFLGIVLALAGGLALGVLWVDATFPYLLGWMMNLHIPYVRLAIVVPATMAACMAAAAVPARRAARLDPAAALRYE